MDVVIPVAIGIAIFASALWVVRLIANPPPPEPEEGHEVAADYRCAVCGLRLTVTFSTGAEVKPPRHCMENMEPTD